MSACDSYFFLAGALAELVSLERVGPVQSLCSSSTFAPSMPASLAWVPRGAHMCLRFAQGAAYTPMGGPDGPRLPQRAPERTRPAQSAPEGPRVLQRAGAGDFLLGLQWLRPFVVEVCGGVC